MSYWLYLSLAALLAIVILLLAKLQQQRQILYEHRRDRTRSRLIWQHFPGVLVEIRPDGTVINASTGLDIKGVDKLIPGRTIQSLLRGEALHTFLCSLESAVSEECIVRFYLTVESGEGVLHFRNQLVPVKRGGRLQSLLMISSDISELTASEAQLEEQRREAVASIDAKRRFLANMSHEIRTPLNGMLGSIGLLESTPMSGQQKAHLNNLQQGADHLLAILNDVLDLSKIESGRLQLTEEQFDLRELLQRVVGIVYARASEKRLALQLFVDDDIPDQVIGDPLRISQILINLLNNAIKFTDKGHVILRVVRPPHEKTAFRFTVEDTGIGIDPAKAPFLFEEYSEAHDERSRALGGTGLGLNICKRLTEAMGGTIGVVSSPDIGSCFWLVLPLQSVSVTSDRALQTLHEGKVLWVADSFAVNRTLVIAVAGKLGMTVRGFDRLRDLISTLALEKPDVLVISRRFFSAPDMLLQYRLLDEVKVCVTCDESNAEGWVPPADLVCATWAWPLDQRRMGAILSRTLAGKMSPDTVITPFTLNDDTAISTPEVENSLPLNVVLVEDNPVNQKVLFHMLQKLNCQVVCRDNGLEALEYLENNSGTDLVIMDRHMPGIDGIETMRRIHLQPQYATLPVVALSGDAMAEQQKEFLDAGATAYLVKPVNPKDLNALLDTFRKERRHVG